MPYAPTHILVPLLFVAIIRDFYLRNKDRRKFPLHYVLIAGLAGTLPDWDIAFFWILSILKIDIGFWDIHKTYLHSLVIPLFFLIMFFVLHPVKSPVLGRHKLTLSKISLMIFIGSLSHVLLDIAFGEPFSPFLPFYTDKIGYSFLSILPEALKGIFYPTVDAALIIIYLVYMELKHKISDFI